MKQMELFDALTYIDDDLILEAHETPAQRHTRFRLGGVYRLAAVMAAVVMLLAVTVGAVTVSTEEWKLQLMVLWQDYAQEEDNGLYWFDSLGSYQTDNNIDFFQDREIPYSFASITTKDCVLDYFVCENEVFRSQIEVMILMEDGRMVYKSHTVEGEGVITNTLDNTLGEETGTIVSMRRLITLPVDDEWALFHEKCANLSGRQGVDVPVGTDIRFPENRYNYDGRANGGSAKPEEPSQILVQNETDVIMVFEPSD